MSSASETQVHLLRPHLRGLPEARLPAGYGLRHFRAGDEELWERIVTQSFERPPDSMPFEKIMKSDPAFRPERILLVTHAGEAIATASAYTRPSMRPNAGQLHYVAVLHAHRGKRLGYWASLSALHQMVAEGFSSAWTATDNFRLPAIHIYMNLGFEPWITDPKHEQRWRDVLARLDRPMPDAFARSADDTP